MEGLISIITPCYNEEDSIPIFYDTLTEVLAEIDIECEVLFINDGSSDNTAGVIEELSEKDKRVAYISLARNFGKEAALYAGLCNASGDYVVVMDADLQDPPSLLVQMLEIIKEGEYDCVATRRVDRKGEPPIRSFFANLFYKLINRFSDTEVVNGARDYRMMSRRMVEAIISMSEYNRFSKGIFGWVGFKTKWLEYENTERVAGETKWSFRKLFSYAIDGIISFSQAPLSVAAWLGGLMTVISFFALIFIIMRKLVYGDPVAGWASTISIILFIGGLQMAVLGVIGQYLAKTYLETKRRPHYIVSDSNREGVKRAG